MILLRKQDLVLDDTEISPVSGEQNRVGICTSCGGDLLSLGYYKHAGRWMVAARCSACAMALLMVYGEDWSWIEDMPLVVEEVEGHEPARASLRVSEVSRERLEVVFTPAEIRDMIAFQEGRPYVRQNLYRARAKLERFERLFGIKIEL
ncbi:MAG: hypothetical protein N3G75_07115 [Methanothrix sp.]|nr:hypothetical protein [Methanothrix sp.]MCX8207587.1 hypothetical protein [Methanothrix sp.]